MLTLLPTPIGNIEDISLRALRVLEEADVLLCEDTRVAKKLLHLLSERHGLKHSIEKFISLHSHNEAETLETFDRTFFERNVVYMSDAGMPCISDPGALLVAYCQKHGVEYTVLPGPSAFATAFAASGFTQTHFTFYGFLPHKGKERENALQHLLGQRWPVILYEAPHRLEKLLEELEKAVPERIIFAAKEITKKHERFFKGTPSELKSEITGPLLKGEWVVIVSPAEIEAETSAISLKEIEALDLPPKQKAKLIAKLTGQPVKECYRNLLTKANN
ncbi:16S rRNA (cytidine(1402)-2'-O)-methyltransferase [Hydrogenimonas cancrithermarum]|uniref:Ribosomal RNA small subunit methyltransferase I n=1 Tax=Hydrogenimonas cancrithermarum TaxID=2993563 RepID=A0ABM8FLZ8_9BACT|nr:16S rRNA (cytidine(1402)-2'-O)-methyltransferase [Hydrogenimonas cancrithermarum]BDY12765.1 ribosomal RNA small subunit methyltransferase I [Hydrogenimonas cancrithermarum]